MPKPLRVSATQLESWRLFMTEPWFTEQRMIETLTGKLEDNETMKRGRALHYGLELAAKQVHQNQPDLVSVKNDQMTVRHEDRIWVFTVAPTTEVTVYAGGDWQHELKGKLEIEPGLLLTGRADALSFLESTVVDYKTSTRPHDSQRHSNSMQWRTYLTIFGLDNFRYDQYQIRADRNDQNLITIRDAATLDLHRYDGMEQDVFAAAREIAEFRHSRGI